MLMCGPFLSSLSMTKPRPLEPEVPIYPQKIDEPLDQGNPPPTPEESVEQEVDVPEEPLQVPIVTQQPKPMVPEQPLPQVLPMPKPMPLHDAIPKVPGQPYSISRLDQSKTFRY